jgi:transglutaminase-like putative cysteine protease
VLTGAAALAFWPTAHARAVLRGEALLLLVALYAVPVTERQLAGALLRGLVLLLLVAAWLWLPRVGLRRALPAAAIVLAVGMLSLPAAAKLNSDQAWWDYSNWQWFGNERGIAFDWDQSYGPLNWSRDGKTLLNVRSNKAHYWRVETLDRFDGLRWMHSQANEYTRLSNDLPPSPQARWITRTKVTVRSLRTDFVVGPGTVYDTRGAGAVSASGDGTTRILDQPLKRGASYRVTSYAPDPRAGEMRAEPARYPLQMSQYTDVYLPRRGETALSRKLRGRGSDQDVTVGRRPVPVPLTGSGEPAATARAGRRLLASPYAGVYRLARRLTAGADTTYDRVKAIENHFDRGFTYSEDVPNHAYPLPAFLFKDKRGYCQQYSGAMALMLRMVGIPARVASGFSPGSYNRDTREYRVRDLDAHAWVEVFFPDIGWVPFDPTPAASPAQSQSSGRAAISAASGNAGDVSGPRRPGQSLSERAGDSAANTTGRDPGRAGTPVGLIAAVVAALALLAILLRMTFRARGRRLGDPVEAAVAELRDALVRMGWRVPAGTTLLALERRLDRLGGPTAAAYAARLREARYSAAADGPPQRAERRALRRALTRGRGPLARARGLIALPPRI